MTDHIKKQIYQDKESLKDYIIKAYDGDYNKAQLDLFVIDKIYDNVKKDNLDDAKRLNIGLKKKYEDMKNEKKWEKVFHILTAVISVLFTFNILFSIMMHILNYKSFHDHPPDLNPYEPFGQTSNKYMQN